MLEQNNAIQTHHEINPAIAKISGTPKEIGDNKFTDIFILSSL